MSKAQKGNKDVVGVARQIICISFGTRKKARKKSRAFVVSNGLNSPCRPCHRQA